jgi:hypothetical protein
MPQKFKVGDTVIFKKSFYAPGGVCVVTKVLPDRNGEREYRVKSASRAPMKSTSGSRRKAHSSQPRRTGN